MRYKNNPFNIRYNGFNRWIGLIGNDNGFCQFDSLEHGIRAAVIILRSYRKKNISTISTIINRFAPSSENNTNNYISYVSSRCLIPRNHVLTTIYDYAYVLYYMAYFESHTFLSFSALVRICFENKILDE